MGHPNREDEFLVVIETLKDTNNAVNNVAETVINDRKIATLDVDKYAGSIGQLTTSFTSVITQFLSKFEQHMAKQDEIQRHSSESMDDLKNEVSQTNKQLSEAILQMTLSNQRMDQIDDRQSKLCEAEILRDKRIGKLETKVELQEQAAKLKWGIFGTTATLIGGGIITIIFKVWGGK